jgi:predicted RNase H-like HicB family nuclease
MASKYYVGIVEGDGLGGHDGYGIFFPDFPGCVSAGATFQEAALSGEEALRAHVALMQADGDEIPEASDPAAIERDPEVDEVARVLVRVEFADHAIRLNVTIEKALLSRIDAAAGAEGLSRSAYLAEAARQRLASA